MDCTRLPPETMDEFQKKLENALNQPDVQKKYDDWRLPNIRELQSIVDFGKSNMAIDTTFQVSPEAVGFWSSTTVDGIHDAAWVVGFVTGRIIPRLKAGRQQGGGHPECTFSDGLCNDTTSQSQTLPADIVAVRAVRTVAQ